MEETETQPDEKRADAYEIYVFQARTDEYRARVTMGRLVRGPVVLSKEDAFALMTISSRIWRDGSDQELERKDSALKQKHKTVKLFDKP